MTVVDAALRYVKENGLRSTMICTNVRRWQRLTGVTAVQEINEEHIVAFRLQAQEAGLAAATIEKTITDTITIVSWVTDRRLRPGKRLPQRRPKPTPLPLEDFSVIFGAATAWLQQWMALSYWTGLRLRDSMRLQLQTPLRTDVIRFQASKTGHPHCWPVPSWLRAYCDQRPLPYRHAGDHSVRILRSHLEAACLAAGVPVPLIKWIRQRSVTEWTRANATAGAIVHGSGLGVLSHYLDPLSVLEAAAPRVRLPDCFGATVDNSTRLSAAYERLDPQGRDLILTTAERLAGA